jgi:hypothetical protein
MRLIFLIALLVLGVTPTIVSPALAELDLWVSRITVEPLVPEFHGYDYTIPTPIAFGIEIRRQGYPLPVPGTEVVIAKNSLAIAVVPVTGDPTQTFAGTTTVVAGDELVVQIDPTHLNLQHSLLNDHLGLGFGFGLGSNNPCAPYPVTITVDDPDGSGDLTLSCAGAPVAHRTGKFPFALLILPPYELAESELDVTMSTTLEQATAHTTEDESSMGVTASLAIEAGFEVGGFGASIGAEIEAAVETAVGHAIERTYAEEYDASCQSQQVLNADHTVVLAQTRYDVVKYLVTAGSTTGQSVWVAVPQAPGTYNNPEMTEYDLGDYDEQKDAEAVGLQAACTIGDADSYSGSKLYLAHIDESPCASTHIDLVVRGRTISTSGASWSETLESGDYVEVMQKVTTSMYAAGEFGGVGVSASFGSSSGESHRIYEGKSSKFAWRIGDVRDTDYEFDAVAYAFNIDVSHDNRNDALLVVDYYVDRDTCDGWGDGTIPNWGYRCHWQDLLGGFAVWQTLDLTLGGPQPGLVTDRIEDLLACTAYVGPGAELYYQLMDEANSSQIAFGEEYSSSYSPYWNEYMEAVWLLDQELTTLQNSGQTTNPEHIPHIMSLERNAIASAGRTFDPRASRLAPAVPRPGEPVTIRYSTRRGTLPESPPVAVRWAVNGAPPSALLPMARDPGSGFWQAVLVVPGDAVTLDYEFTNGVDTDDRSGLGWHAPTAGPLRSHAVGEAILSVTDRGLLGFTDNSQTTGRGFHYPAASPNWLFTGGFWVGNASYVANRDFDADPAADWQVVAAEPGPVRIACDHPDFELGSARFDDGAGPDPHGLEVTATSTGRGMAPDSNYVLLTCVVRNRGAAPLDGVWVGLYMDFDLDASHPNDNEGAVESGLDLAYLRGTGTSYAGICAVDPEPAANISLVHNPTYVHPLAYITDLEKARFLAGVDPDHRVAASWTPSDWSVVVSAGPYDLAPGAGVPVTFAVVGGTDLADLRGSAESARRWVMTGGTTEIAGPPAGAVAARFHLGPNAPNPFAPATVIPFELAAAGHVTLRIYDVAGRCVVTLIGGPLAAGPHAVRWDGRMTGGASAPAGVYFYRLVAGGQVETRKMARAK